MAEEERELNLRQQGGEPGEPVVLSEEAAAANEVIQATEEEPSPELTDTEQAVADAEGLSSDLLDVPDLFSDEDELDTEDVSLSEEEEFLLDEDDEPGSLFDSINRPRGTPPPPEGLAEWLPTLAMMARDPQAPPGVKILFNTIIDALFPFTE